MLTSLAPHVATYVSYVVCPIHTQEHLCHHLGTEGVCSVCVVGGGDHDVMHGHAFVGKATANRRVGSVELISHI